MSKLVLIDAMAILHRAYYALPPMTGRAGQPTNAIYGFVSMLLRIIQDLKPTHIIVAFDREEPTFRRKLFEEYQTQRKPTDDDLASQFRLAREVMKAFHIPTYDLAGYEADDIIGTIAAKSGEIDEVVIVTGDKDQLQLVNDKVKVYMPIVGLTNAKLLGATEVVEKMGVLPAQIIDFKALVGDPSDNYPGVTGIGPKTATGLLSEYKSLEVIYANLNQIPSKTADKLRSGKDSAYLSQKLATIVTDVPLKFDFDAASKWEVGGKDVLEKFAEIGFKTLTQRVKEVGKELEKEKQISLL